MSEGERATDVDECTIHYEPLKSLITVTMVWPTRGTAEVITNSITFSITQLRYVRHREVRRGIVEGELSKGHKLVVPPGVVDAVLALAGG